MTIGRPNKGVEHVNSLAGEAREKQRLQAILATFTGELSVAEASRHLGISETRFAKLRTRALQGALAGLAPLPVGRPPTMESASSPDRTTDELEDKLEKTGLERKLLQELLDLGLGVLGESREKKGGKHQGGKRRKGR